MIPNSEVGTARRAVRGRLGEATLPQVHLRPADRDIFLICVNLCSSVALYSFSFVHFASIGSVSSC
jgi:hypothetical protein